MRELCRACGSKKNRVIFSDGQWAIIECIDCDYGWLEPYLSYMEAKNIYNRRYFDDKAKSFYNLDAEKKYKFVSKYLDGRKKLLDFGCGLGDFIKVFKNKNDGYIMGYDISKHAASVTKKLRISAKTGKIGKSDFKESSFDVIVCFDVIEHVTNFQELLQYFHYWLRGGGVLIMTTPDKRSWDAKLMGRKWYGFRRIPQHINYFSKKSIKSLVNDAQFEVEVVKTWGFVRNLKFLSEALLRRNIFGDTGWGRRAVYIPMVDMIIVARKK